MARARGNIAPSVICVLRELIVTLEAQKHMGLDHAGIAHLNDSAHRQRNTNMPFTIMWGNGGDTVGQMHTVRKGNTLCVFGEDGIRCHAVNLGLSAP